MEYISGHGKRLGFILDVLVITLIFYLSYYLSATVKGYAVFAYGGSVYIETRAITLVAWLASLLLFGEYPVRRQRGIGTEIWVAMRVNVLAMALCGVTAFVFKVHDISRLFIIVYGLCALLFMVLSRISVRLTLYAIRGRGKDLKTRLIVGGGINAERYYRDVHLNRRFGIRILGYVDEQPSNELQGTSYLGDVESLPKVLKEHQVDGVVVTMPLTAPSTEAVIRQCEIQGVQVELLLDSLSSRIACSRITHSGGLSRMVLSPIPHSSIELAWKRVTDAMVSAAALIILSPLLLILAIIIKSGDQGPVVFSQERVGLHGRKFKMYKFRSMVTDAEQKKKELLHLNEMSGPVFKVSNDPRVTPIGRVLRQTSLDELPQLWNVLTGDMSLVGPRPPLPSEVNQYDYSHRRRLSVKPGLTCLWQISGRNNIDFEQWMNMDLVYIDNWSYINDWKIMFRTIPAVLKRHGAS